MVNWLLFDSPAYLDTPYQLIGWIGWFVMSAILLWIIRQHSERPLTNQFWRVFIPLLFLTVLCSLFFAVMVPLGGKLPIPNMPVDHQTPAIMMLSFIPLLFAAGLLGTWPTVVLGFISGILNGLWNTHTIFTSVETAMIAAVISLAINQNYRTEFFKFLRQPLGAALTAGLTAIPLVLISTFFGTNGNLAAKLDYAFTESWVTWMIMVVAITAGGVFCQLLGVVNLKGWIRHKILVPSPIEIGLQSRILFTALPMVGVLLLTLIITDWVVAGRAAREMLRGQLENSATIVVENLPNVIETGQSLTTSLSQDMLKLNEKEELKHILKEKIREIPFFNQIFVFDLTGNPITGYPADSLNQLRLSSEETAAIQLALNGVLIQNCIIPPDSGDGSAQLSFIASIPDEYGLSKGVIIARTNFSMNLFSEPMISSFRSIEGVGGEAVIIDEFDRVIYQTNPVNIMSVYEGVLPEASTYFEDSGSTGTRHMVFVGVNEDLDWKVVLTLPASYAQELALRIAIPLLIISLLISFLAYLFLRYLVKTLTLSLNRLAEKADEISKGELGDEIDVKGVDEIGRLGTAFEQMRVSLKLRLEELDTLLQVSQGVAASLDIASASTYLLKAALSYGATAASLVLLHATDQNPVEEPQVFRLGNNAEVYSYLDRGLTDLYKGEKVLIIPSKARIKRMGFPKDVEQPAALAGIAINDGDNLAGFMWIVYSQTHRFLDPEIRFLNTLAGQTVMAVNNSNLYHKAEIGKHQLESVLASTPEPVFVIGEAGHVVVANTAAERLTELIEYDFEYGNNGSIKSELLKEFIDKNNLQDFAEELELENGKTYLVSVSPIQTGDNENSKVCVLRDVTVYKELAKMKSEFVATVSHGLKTPMGLIRGYASMLQMVGQLNDQQKDYSNRIIEEVDNISRMADNLLDLGRIDSGEELKIEKISPHELADRVIGLLQPQANNRKVQILRELTLAQELTINGDKALLQQALYNILENAVKFSPVGGKVSIRLQVMEKSIIFEIQDHGPGIAPIDLPGIFNQHSRDVKLDKPGKSGSGLGLSIVKSIALRHQGRVWAESVLGKGCIFYLEIPREQSTNKDKIT